MQELLLMQNIKKSFPGVQALRGVSLAIRAGEVHALIGENGAGKSTLMKIMQGVEKPDAGSMMMNGVHYAPQNPKKANSLGVGMVCQEQSLITNLTVAQNRFFGEEDKF